MVCSESWRMMPHTWKMIISKQVAAPSEIHFIVLTGQQLLYGMQFAIVVQFLSCVWLPATPWTTACLSSLSFIISQSLLKLMSIESMMPSNNLILCHLLLLLPSIFLSIRVSSSESALCIRWPEYWSFSISTSKEYSGVDFLWEWCDIITLFHEHVPFATFPMLGRGSLTLSMMIYGISCQGFKHSVDLHIDINAHLSLVDMRSSQWWNIYIINDLRMIHCPFQDEKFPG